MEDSSLGEVAAANDVAPSTLSDWKNAFKAGKLYSDAKSDKKEMEIELLNKE